jgi:hypothetical protein
MVISNMPLLYLKDVTKEIWLKRSFTYSFDFLNVFVFRPLGLKHSSNKYTTSNLELRERSMPSRLNSNANSVLPVEEKHFIT